MQLEQPLKLKDTEVFITDVKNNIQANKVRNELLKSFPQLTINFDLSEEELSYPCGHTVLKVEGREINSDKIKSTVKHIGFSCEVIEDKICV